jgi:hypothetical protein
VARPRRATCESNGAGGGNRSRRPRRNAPKVKKTGTLVWHQGRAKRGNGAGGGNRTHTPGDRREILSLVRLPVSPLRPKEPNPILSGVYGDVAAGRRVCMHSNVPLLCPRHVFLPIENGRAANSISPMTINPFLLSFGGASAAAICAIGVENAWQQKNVLGGIAWGLGLLISIALSTIPTWRNKLDQTKVAAETCITKALKACAMAYGHPGRHVRVNVMLAQQGRRKVVSKTAFNMTADPDNDIEIDTTAGVSGEAYSLRVPTFGDLTVALQPGVPTWGLKPAELAKIRTTLKSILSVPIFDPDNPTGELLGTLQVDSDLTYTEMQFDLPERRELAERFADVIALLLKAGR